MIKEVAFAVFNGGGLCGAKDLHEICFASAPLIDVFNREAQWMLQPYVYCLFFGFLSVVIFWIIARCNNCRIEPIESKIKRWFSSKAICRILVIGILLAVPFGIIMRAIWFSAGWFAWILFPVIAIAYMCVLLSKKWLSGIMLRALIIISLSCVTAIGMFILFTKLRWLPSSMTDEILLNSGEVWVHPFDSAKNMLVEVPLFIEIGVVCSIIRGVYELVKKGIISCVGFMQAYIGK